MEQLELNLLQRTFQDPYWRPVEEKVLLQFARKKAIDGVDITDVQVAGQLVHRIATIFSRLFPGEFSDQKIESKLRQMRTRFFQFHRFIHSEGVRYRYTSNVVQLHDSYWERWRDREEPLLYRYFRHHGHPNYYAARYIFKTKKITDLAGDIDEEKTEAHSLADNDSTGIPQDPHIEDTDGDDDDFP